MQMLNSYRKQPFWLKVAEWMVIWLAVFVVLGKAGIFNLWTFIQTRL